MKQDETSASSAKVQSDMFCAVKRRRVGIPELYRQRLKALLATPMPRNASDAVAGQLLGKIGVDRYVARALRT